MWWLGLCTAMDIQDLMPHPHHQWVLGRVLQPNHGERQPLCLGFSTRYYVVRWLGHQLLDNNGDFVGEWRHHLWLHPRLYDLVSVRSSD